MRAGWLLGLLLIFSLALPAVSGRAEQSFGDKIKKIFEPTPPPKKKKTSHPPTTKKKSTPTPSPSPETKPTPEPEETPAPRKKSASARKSPSPSPTPEANETPKPKKKHSPSPSPSPKHKKKSPTTPEPEETSSPTPEASPTPEESPTPSASPSPKKAHPPGATVSPNDISGIEKYPTEVRKVIETALGLTTRDLEYKYGSADPDSGGLDCSGFVYYVLTQNGLKDVPRDASGQYSWVRKSGTFQAVISRSEDTFELDELKPGDLLFWTGTYDVEKDPPITHTMIYLGREKKTNHRIMVGASDGRVYHGESRYGVGVFDFKVPRSDKASTSGRSPTFVGYGRVPGLGDG
ncbi:MAG: NlpC/P60 family protein [Verrucomicrobiota bacterium]|nr:NlpC/P60 family protein [Verrucomicrobiota bacterium]